MAFTQNFHHFLGLFWSIGSLGKNGDYHTVEDVRVENCNLTGTTNGLRIKTVPVVLHITKLTRFFLMVSKGVLINRFLIM